MPPLKSLPRQMVTPVTTIVFAVSSVTGLMLFLHWNGTMVKTAHEWLGLVFAGAGLWHLGRNWKAFAGYLRRPASQWALGASLAVTLAVIALTGTTSSSGGPGAVFRALSAAPLAQAAPALGLSPDQALMRLAAARIEAAPEDKLSDIAGRAGVSPMEVAALLVASPAR